MVEKPRIEKVTTGLEIWRNGLPNGFYRVVMGGKKHYAGDTFRGAVKLAGEMYMRQFLPVPEIDDLSQTAN